MIGGRAATGRALAVAAMLAPAACASAPVPGDQPAVLTNPTAQSRRELSRVVNAALHGAAVTLADDALTRDGALIVERARSRNAEGTPRNGRETRRPEHFRLVMRGGRCVLVHERTGRRWTLAAATCAPLLRSGVRP